MVGKVTVMGGGIFGLAVAWSCLRAGASVRVIEARHMGAGASGGLVGALAPHVPERWAVLKQVQRDALLGAGAWWGEVARVGGCDPGYMRVGRIQPLADATAVRRAKGLAAGAAAHWLDGHDWKVVASGAAPGLAVAAGSGMLVHDTLSARINPRRAVAALLAAIRAAGAEVKEGAGFDAAPADGCTAVIWATGWEGLAGISGLAGGGVKGQALLLRYEVPKGTPIITASGLYIVPHDDGTVAVGSTKEPEFTVPDATDARLDALLCRAVSVCPALSAAPVVERWAGVRPRADGHGPVVGPWPGRPGHYIANGGHGIGFAIAPLVGAMLADLVVRGRDRIPGQFLPENRQ